MRNNAHICANLVCFLLNLRKLLLDFAKIVADLLKTAMIGANICVKSCAFAVWLWRRRDCMHVHVGLYCLISRHLHIKPSHTLIQTLLSLPSQLGHICIHTFNFYQL